MLQPDNFLYTITLFTIAIISGVALLLRNKRNSLLIISSLVFFLCAIRILTEYYIQQLDNHALVLNIIHFHRILVVPLCTCLWYIIWFYVRPLSAYKWEQKANQIYFWLVLIAPMPLIIYGNFYGDFYEIPPYKIDGLWRYKLMDTLPAILLLRFFLLIVLGGIIAFTMLTEIIRKKENRTQKIIATLLFLGLPFIAYYLMSTKDEMGYQTANLGMVYLIFGLTITWFLSDYRTFFNSFQKTIEDLLDSVSDLAFFTTLDFKITHSNQLATQMFGQQTIHQNMVHILANYTEKAPAAIEQIIQNLTISKGRAEILSLKHLETSQKMQLKIAKFEQGNLHLGYTFLFTNLTDILEREAQLQQANTIKDQLFAIIGHDLRKPALAFRGVAQKINYLTQTDDKKRIQQLGTTLEQAALDLNKLLNNILKWALNQKNAVVQNRQELVLSSVITEVIALFKYPVQHKKIQIHNTVSPQQTIFCDYDILLTVLRNILDNAIKFSPIASKINIYTTVTDKYLSIHIQDFGIGMDEQQNENLFTLVANKSQQGTQGEKGTGIGMVLIKELTTLVDGIIQVNSRVNQGTTVVLNLPQQNMIPP